MAHVAFNKRITGWQRTRLNRDGTGNTNHLHAAKKEKAKASVENRGLLIGQNLIVSDKAG